MNTDGNSIHKLQNSLIVLNLRKLFLCYLTQMAILQIFVFRVCVRTGIPVAVLFTNRHCNK